jgi:hypothetical protein
MLGWLEDEDGTCTDKCETDFAVHSDHDPVSEARDSNYEQAESDGH